MPDSIVRVGACPTPGWPWSVAYQDSHAYVGSRQALVIIDVTIPSNPSIVGILSTIHIQPLAVFVVDTVAHTIQIGPEFAAASIADPTAPYQLGWCPIPIWTQEPKGLAVIDTFAFLPDADNGLQVVNVAQPNAPALVGSLDTPGVARDLFVQTTIAYVADGDSLQVANVSDPTDPFRLGALAMPNLCYDVFVVDTFAYVTCLSTSGFNGSLQVVSVSDPSSPQIVASLDNIVGDPLDVWISGSYAYVATADYPPIDGGVRVIDISDPLSPSLVATYDTPGDPRGVFAVGDLVFVADYDSLQILRHIATGINESTVEQQPAVLRLRQNQPNPFTDFTTIRYELPTAGSVTLEIYDVIGRLVRTLVDAAQPAGLHTAMWNGRDDVDRKLASGIYFYRLTVQTEECCGKMILLR